MRDAQGNVLGVYGYTPASDQFTWKEQHLYGSSRLGMLTPELVQWTDDYDDTHDDDLNQVGMHKFELTNHLGNVLATISDKQIRKYTVREPGATPQFNHNEADVISSQDYYPFGMQMPERTFVASGGGKYRYGFNGQEHSIELEGDDYTAQFWEYDARIGRRWNIDPVLKVWESPYLCFSGNPISVSDIHGDDGAKTLLQKNNGERGSLKTLMNKKQHGEAHLSLASTEVTKNENGTYTVLDSKPDGDRNIYVVDDKKKRTGEIIGKTLTDYSFMYDNNTPAIGAIINTNDYTGANFLNKTIIDGLEKGQVDFLPYLLQAYGRKKYDFKAIGIDKIPADKQEQYKYRGMPFANIKNYSSKDGTTLIIATARDIGNVSAGYVAGSYGLSWQKARLGFDGLESLLEGHLTSEKQTTQRAQRIGFDMGSKHIINPFPYNDSPF